jgi:GNAT superfamily N-acetyltransferase
MQVENITTKIFDKNSEMMLAFPLIKQMYPKLDIVAYKENINEMTEGGNYKMLAVFMDENLVGITGFWMLRRFYCGRYIQIGNMVVDANKRGAGIGRVILQKIEEIARENNCHKIILDSYTENKKSHSLYFREGFFVEGLHFMKNLTDYDLR